MISWETCLRTNPRDISLIRTQHDPCRMISLVMNTEHTVYIKYYYRLLVASQIAAGPKPSTELLVPATSPTFPNISSTGHFRSRSHRLSPTQEPSNPPERGSREEQLPGLLPTVTRPPSPPQLTPLPSRDGATKTCTILNNIPKQDTAHPSRGPWSSPEAHDVRHRNHSCETTRVW